MEIDFNRRDSLLIEQMKFLLRSNVSVIIDQSRTKITEYKDSVNPVTGEQLVNKETEIDNNIVSKDSANVAEGEKKVDAGGEVVIKGSEEVKEEKGMSSLAQALMWIGIMSVFVGIIGVLKWLKII